MQVVIDMPDSMRDWLENGFADEDDYKKLWEVVKRGTPLPENCGRVIDADVFLIWLIFKGYIDNARCGEVAEAIKKTTIIPATKDTEKELAESIMVLIPHLPTESDKARMQIVIKEGDYDCTACAHDGDSNMCSECENGSKYFKWR